MINPNVGERAIIQIYVAKTVNKSLAIFTTVPVKNSLN